MPKRSKQKKKGKSESGDSSNNNENENESPLTVFVRVRPLLPHESSKGSTDIISIINEKVIVLQDPNHNSADILRAHRSREKHYTFDTVFSAESSQMEVFERATKPLLADVLDGYNATVFAYGPTGAGKTYTMLGTDDKPGVMIMTIRQLFDMIATATTHDEIEATMSYIELYNENLYDLLVENSDELDLREDGSGNSVICGARKVPISKAEHVLHLLVQGNKRRTQEATAANPVSSRSHAILCINVTRKDSVQGLNHTCKTGTLFLCDLAGSERARNTLNTGIRMVEGQHINRSLLALGNCINSLSKPDSTYVNFRDSKLTRLLKDSLGGTCKTVMIAHLSPASAHFEETYNTLVYANRAKEIKTNLQQHVKETQTQIAQYQTVIERLEEQVRDLQKKLSATKSTNQSTQPSATQRIARSARTRIEQRQVSAKPKVIPPCCDSRQYLNLSRRKAALTREIQNLKDEIVCRQMISIWNGPTGNLSRPYESLSTVDLHSQLQTAYSQLADLDDEIVDGDTNCPHWQAFHCGHEISCSHTSCTFRFRTLANVTALVNDERLDLRRTVQLQHQLLRQTDVEFPQELESQLQQLAEYATPDVESVIADLNATLISSSTSNHDHEPDQVEEDIDLGSTLVLNRQPSRVNTPRIVPESQKPSRKSLRSEKAVTVSNVQVQPSRMVTKPRKRRTAKGIASKQSSGHFGISGMASPMISKKPVNGKKR